MKPAVAAHEPLNLTGETLNQLAWRIPDLVAYQHSEDEWWLAPLDDNLPIIRLNRTGLELLQEMTGHTTVGALAEKYGTKVCGPDGQPGQWHLQRWALPTYSLCYYGTEPPGGHRHKAKWDVLLQQVREGWSGQGGFEGETHLEDFHRHELIDSGEYDGHFDLIETTVSHLFREPNDTLNGLTYGRLLMRQLRKLGWFVPKPHIIVEVGGGLGYLACELGKELLPFEKQTIRYISLDITRPFLTLQVNRARAGGWNGVGARANGEWLPFKDNSVDLVIDNENMADMTPVKLTRKELFDGKGDTLQHQEALDWIRRVRPPLGTNLPEDVIFNLGPFRFVAELWRVLKPGGRAFLTEFGIEEGWPAPVKLPGHTEYETHFGHLRQAARWLVDYQSIAERLLKGQYRVHQAFLPQGLDGALDERPFKLDVDKAKQILRDAGINEGTSISLIVINQPPYTDIAQALQASFAQAGLRLDIHPVVESDLWGKMRGRDFQAIFTYWGADYLDPNTNASAFAYNDGKSSTVAGLNGWQIPQLNKQTLAALAEADPAKRRARYTAMQQELQRSSPYVFIDQAKTEVVLRDNVKGYQQGLNADMVYYDRVSK